MEEIWKPIKGLEGSYEVSSKGRVRSVSRDIHYKLKGTDQVRHYDGRILSLSARSGGYLGVMVVKEHPQKLMYGFVHRLVAEAFLENPEGFRNVSHIDGDVANNDVTNLKWTNSYMIKKNRRVFLIDCDTGERYESIRDVENKYGKKQLLRAIKAGNRWYEHKIRYMTEEEISEWNNQRYLTADNEGNSNQVQ